MSRMGFEMRNSKRDVRWELGLRAQRSPARHPISVIPTIDNSSRRRLRELALGRVGRTRRSGSRNTRRRALSGGPDQTPWHRSSRALNVARFPIFTADQTRCRGRGPGRAAVCRADEKQIECKSLRMRREPATTPAWVLSWGIEMAKTENRKTVVRGEGSSEGRVA